MTTRANLWVTPVLLVLVARLVMAFFTDAYFDEAYYWVWAQHLDFGYFDHPPLIAWLIQLLGMRGTALLCGLATLAAVYGFARDLEPDSDQGRERGLRAAALWSVVPAGTLAGTFATPDSPLLLFWTLSLWAIHKERWIWAGVACGLALLSKYSAVLLAPVFLLDCVGRRRFPKGVFLTLGIALLLFSPVIFWNACHGWQGFAFQLHHGLSGHGGLQSVGRYLAGQVGMGGPLIFALSLAWIVRGRGSFLLRAGAWVPLLFFAYAAFRTRGEANWPAMAYAPACLALSGEKPKRWLLPLASASAVLIAVAAAHLSFMLVHIPDDVPLSRIQGWSALRKLRPPNGDSAAQAVFAPNYQMASEAQLYAHLPAGTSGVGRRSQFDLWGPPTVGLGQSALWVSEGQTPPPELRAQYTGVEGPVHHRAFVRGVQLHDFQVWTLSGRR